MATIRKEIRTTAPADHVWDVIRDIGAIHQRLAPGYVTDTRMEEGGAARIVTFANGVVARELIVTLDNDSRRLAYSVAGGMATHHTPHSRSSQPRKAVAARRSFGSPTCFPTPSHPPSPA